MKNEKKNKQEKFEKSSIKKWKRKIKLLGKKWNLISRNENLSLSSTFNFHPTFQRATASFIQWKNSTAATKS